VTSPTTFLIFGGRDGPENCYNDLHSFDVTTVLSVLYFVHFFALFHPGFDWFMSNSSFADVMECHSIIRHRSSTALASHCCQQHQKHIKEFDGRLWRQKCFQQLRWYLHFDIDWHAMEKVGGKILKGVSSI
jgi:hypothetical protein